MTAPMAPRLCHQHRDPQIQQRVERKEREAKERKKERMLKKKSEAEVRTGQRETPTSKSIGKQQFKVTVSELERISY